MTRKLVTVVGVGALTFAVYLATGSTVQVQVNELADAGLGVPNRDAVCPVRLDADYAADAGVKLYQRLRFPVVLTVLPDAGRDVQLPPMPVQVRQAIDVVDWSDCQLSASTGPVAALWGDARPFQVVVANLPWCRAKLPTLPCLLLDGGAFGDRNVSPCTTRADPATCERIGVGTIYLGDDSEGL